jgi:hypothetical protein
MSLKHFFYEPFYSTSELERFVDDTLSARNHPNSQVAGTSADKSLKPRYTFIIPVHSVSDFNVGLL